MKQTTKLIVLACTVLLLLGIAGCGGQANSKEKVAEVNGQALYQDDLNTRMEQVKSSLKQQGQDLETKENQERLASIKEQILDQMINNEVLLQKAKEEGIKVDQEKIDSRIEDFKTQFENESKFKEALQEQNLTLEQLKEELASQMKRQKLMQEKINQDNISVSEEEIKSYFDQLNKQQSDQDLKYEEIKPRIKQMLQQEKMKEERTRLQQKWKEQMEIKKYLNEN